MPKYVWFKSYDDELDDPKIQRLGDLEYRVWRTALSFCNRSPYRDRERGYLYHSKGFPVEPLDFAFKLAKPVDEVAVAIQRLCEIGGDASLLLREKNGNDDSVLRVRAWRKRQSGASGDDSEPEDPKHTQKIPPLDVDVDVDVDVKKTLRRKRPAAASCVYCQWRADHQQEPVPAGKRFRWQRYHDESVTVLGISCLSIGAKERRLLKAAAEQYGEDVVWEWWQEFLRRPSRIGHALAVFCSKTNLQAHAEKAASRGEEIDP